MRELTVRIRFTRPCLGNAKESTGGRYRFTTSPGGAVLFLTSWHQVNMRFAAQILGRHQDEVNKIQWDIEVDGAVDRDSWFRRFFATVGGGRSRYSLHESFKPGQIVGLNCVVPNPISDDDFWRLMQLAGSYRGLSPFKHGEYGFYEVVSVRPRRELPAVAEETAQETGPDPVATPDRAPSARRVQG